MELFTTESHREWLKRQITDASSAEFIRIRAELQAEADIRMKNPLYSVTFSESRAVSGNPHDYYSEGPYWWPDPKNPGGPFIRRDGEFYPGHMNTHRRDMEKMTCDAYILSAAGYLLGRQDCTARANQIIRTWFLDEATKMNPHLNYAQAIFGHTPGRGIGIIDTTTLIRLIAAMEFFASCDGTADTVDGLKEWFCAYLNWMDTSKNGIDERDYFNNHANWWNAQAASYAAFLGDGAMLSRCFARFTDVIIPGQTGADGSFTDELTRTKSFSYSMFNLEACAVTAEIAHHRGMDLWNAVCADGKGIAKSLDFMLPFYENPLLWKHPQIVFDGGSPSAAFQLGGVRIDGKYSAAAKKKSENRRYFTAGSHMGALCLLEGCFH